MVSGAKQSPLAWRIRRGGIYRWWRRWRDPATEIRKRGEENFYRRLLEGMPPGAIVDIGANLGSKAEIFVKLTDRVIAVEPDAAMAAVLKARFGDHPRFTLLERAVSARAGELRFFVFAGAAAYNTAETGWKESLEDASRNRFGVAFAPAKETRVMAVTLQDILREYGPACFVKIDVEGHEYEVISTLDVPVPLVSLEFNLPEFQEALEQSVRKLASVSAAYRFNAAISEPPDRLEFAEWLPAEETIARIRQEGWLFVELFARLGSR
jgi:FkbM family methyltransferase